MNRVDLPSSIARALGLPGASAPIAPNTPIAASPVAGGAAAAVSDTSEEFSGTYPWAVTGALNFGERLVYATQRRWRGVDVYISQLGLQGAMAVFTVRVYAIVPGGLRVLIETGRLGRFSEFLANIAPSAPLWVAAARAQATYFEVTVELQQDSGGPTLNGDVTVTVVASNEANPPPAWLGVLRLGVGVLANTITSLSIPNPELVELHAVPVVGVVAPRYLHVHDLPSPFAALGAAPAFCFPICGPNGVPVGNGVTRLRYRSTAGAFVILSSSTAAATTSTADCALQAVMR
jgi:hypothetical protein